MVQALNGQCPDGNIPGNGLGKGRLPGTRRPVGPEDPNSKVVNERQRAETDPLGQQRITGFSKGGTFSKIPSREVGGTFQRTAQKAAEALDRQRVPPEAADMTRGYFEKLGGQK